MRVPDVNIHRPKTVAQACAILRKHGDCAKLIAGGTDIIVDLKGKRTCCDHLVSIAGIPGLDAIKQDGKQLSIGANVTLADGLASPELKAWLPALTDALSNMATPQVRNVATICGNVVSAVPSADLPPALMCCGAKAVLAGSKGKRAVPLGRFFLGVRKTAIREGEMLTEIVIPKQAAGVGGAYEKFQLREAAALAVVGVSAMVQVKDGKIKDACVVLGAVAPTPVVACKASAHLVGRKPSAELFEKAGEIACDEGKPISDVRGSKEFRCQIIGVLTKRALERALQRAGGNCVR
jgi:CO/xanthine dehydrogenase FAD-binding subunit